MDKLERDSFIFYRSFLESIEEAEAESQLRLYRAIAHYALNREEPKLKGMERAVWLAIKPQLDANFKRYLNGKKGGAPRGNSNAKKQPKNNQKQPNENHNENHNDNEDANPDAPHSLDEVKLFFQKHCNADDWEDEAVCFYYNFEACGWRTSDPNFNPEVDECNEGVPVKNWRALATSWIKNWSDKPKYRQRLKYGFNN